MAKYLIPERMDNLTDVLETLKEGLKKSLFTAMIGIVSEDTQDGHTGKATSAIMSTVTDPMDVTTTLDFPAFEDLPIHYPGGGDVVDTHPVKQSTQDEALLISVARNIDSWHQNGGEQMPLDNRVHTLSDMVMIPGLRSDPRKLSNVSSVSGQKRSVDGNHIVDLHPQNGITHQSNQMVLSQVGQSSAVLLTPMGHKVDTAKILLNCG